MILVMYLFHLVHSDVALVQERFYVLAIAVAVYHSDAYAEITLVHSEFLTYGRFKLSAAFLKLFARVDVVDQSELIAAETCSDRVRKIHINELRQPDKYGVACVVTEGVVDSLEVIEIEVEQIEGLFDACCAFL